MAHQTKRENPERKSFWVCQQSEMGFAHLFFVFVFLCGTRTREGRAVVSQPGELYLHNMYTLYFAIFFTIPLDFSTSCAILTLQSDKALT